MEPTPEFRKQQFLEMIELPELVLYSEPAHDGLKEQADEAVHAEDGSRGLEFVVYVESLACFGVQVTGAWIAGFGEEGGTDMP